MRNMHAIVIAGCVLIAAPVRLPAQDPLSVAKDLYASAAYEEALSKLTALAGNDSEAPEIARQIEEYRAFCLYALGRTTEAEAVAEALIRREPLTKLAPGEVSPRLELMFSNVRKRLLPTLIRERFRAARTAIDQKKLSAAEPQLVEARLMIADAQALGVPDEGLADLSVLVEGFLELVLSRSAQAAKPSAPAAAPESAPVATRQVARSEPATPSGPRLYGVADVEVTPPTAINQKIPPIAEELQKIVIATKSSAILEIIIDEKGTVVDAILRRSLSPPFDNLLLGFARQWKYRPAMKDGVPVRYTKTLLVVP